MRSLNLESFQSLVVVLLLFRWPSRVSLLTVLSCLLCFAVSYITLTFWLYTNNITLVYLPQNYRPWLFGFDSMVVATSFHPSFSLSFIFYNEAPKVEFAGSSWSYLSNRPTHPTLMFYAIPPLNVKELPSHSRARFHPVLTVDNPTGTRNCRKKDVFVKRCESVCVLRFPSHSISPPYLQRQMPKRFAQQSPNHIVLKTPHTHVGFGRESVHGRSADSIHSNVFEVRSESVLSFWPASGKVIIFSCL